MSLLGGGLLPLAFTEIVQSSIRDRDFGLRSFLDLFSNRLADLLYDAFAKYRIVLEMERRPLTGRSTIDGVLPSVIGLEMQSLMGRLGIPDAAITNYTRLCCADYRAPPKRRSGPCRAHSVRRSASSGSWANGC